jgi:hypothetical protein
MVKDHKNQKNQTKESIMKTTWTKTGLSVLAVLMLSNISAFAAAGENETYKNLTLEERLYLFDGYGDKWGVDVGNDGLWFVPERPISDIYGAPLKVRNGAKINTLVIGNNDDTNVTAGYVGIGTDAPVEMVDVNGTDGAARFQLTSVTNTKNEAAQFIQRRAHSNSGEPAAIVQNDNIGLFSFRGYTGTTFTGSKAMIAVSAAQNWSDSANGTQMKFRVTPNGTTSMITALEIQNSGDVLIPAGNLYVKGTKMDVPDYVFENNYDLMPLEDLKTFIEKNNHLPGVTSAEEVGKKGVVNLSGLQMKLLEKVEELTLYTLEQEEKLKAKNAEINEMKERLSRLETILGTMKVIK